MPLSTPSSCRRLLDVTAPWFHADANALFRVGESLSSLLALILELHGRASAELQHPDEVPALERSVRLDPSRPTALWALGNAYAALERWPEAVTAFEAVFRAVSCHPYGTESLGGHFAMLHGCFGAALDAVGRSRDAAAVLAQGALEGATDAHLLETLGEVLVKAGRGDLCPGTSAPDASTPDAGVFRERLCAIVFELASPEVSEVLGVEGDPRGLPAAPVSFPRSIRLERPTRADKAPLEPVDPQSPPAVDPETALLCCDPED